MKTLIIIAFLSLTTFAFAEEVKTECLAMNGNRDKIVKEVRTKISKTKGSSSIQ